MSVIRLDMLQSHLQVMFAGHNFVHFAVYSLHVVVRLSIIGAFLGFVLQECEHNPKKPVLCELGCGFTIPKDELKVCSTDLH